MVKLRKMLTEILLNVTNEEIQAVAEEAYEEEKNKIKFVFKEPKFKPKRAKPPANVLGTSFRYCRLSKSSLLPSSPFMSDSLIVPCSKSEHVRILQ